MRRRPPPRKREETKQETREALLRAGMELFGEHGLDGPSLDAICERAGFTRGAFYVHFKDRDQFLEAVMDQVGGAFLDAVIVDSSAAGPGGLGETVRRFVESMASGGYPLAPRGGVKPHQLLEACARSKVIRRRYVKLIQISLERLTTVLQAGQRERAVRPDVAAAEVSTLLLALVIGAQTMLELGLPIDTGRAAATVLRLLAGRASDRV